MLSCCVKYPTRLVKLSFKSLSEFISVNLSGNPSGPTALTKFEDEMRSQNVSHWSTTKYGQVSHGWTDPTSANYRKFEANQAHNNMFSLYSEILESL